MYLNSDSTKINDFFLQNNLQNLSESFLSFLAAGNKLDKNTSKRVLKLIRAGDPESVKNIFSDLFSSAGFSLLSASGKISSYPRVKKFRRKKKASGFKSVSFQVSKSDYRLLQSLKKEKKMTYSQLFSFFLHSF